MPVYWSMLIVTSIIGLISYSYDVNRVKIENRYVERIYAGFAIVAVAYILFFVGFRDNVLDTYLYISTFNSLPNTFSELIMYLKEREGDLGFYFLAGIFKILISENHYAWLFFLGITSGVCLFRNVYKYSEDFPMSMYLFITGCYFTWFVNGARQFLAVCILFAFTDWLIEGKKLKYCLVVLLASTIHSSAIFLLPISLFVSSKKILDKKMMLFGIIAVVGINYSQYVFSFLGSALDMDYADALSDGNGSSVIRLLVNCVPIIISVISKKYIERNAPPSIKLAVNMSFVGVCFSLASTFTNGILIGRMPIYFSVYDLYLMPWLLKKSFEKKSSIIMTLLFVIFYLFYFIFQMEIAWGGLQYYSEILNLSY